MVKVMVRVMVRQGQVNEEANNLSAQRCPKIENIMLLRFKISQTLFMNFWAFLFVMILLSIFSSPPPFHDDQQTEWASVRGPKKEMGQGSSKQQLLLRPNLDEQDSKTFRE